MVVGQLHKGIVQAEKDLQRLIGQKTPKARVLYTNGKYGYMIGGGASHALFGYNLQFLSVVGILALSGVIVNDTLILLDADGKTTNSIWLGALQHLL